MDDAFFAQLLADLEHDEVPTGPDATSEEQLWAAHLPPSAPADFSAEDRALRALLVSFYKSRNPENLSSVNAIVSSYSGDSCELWAQLGVKYQVPPVEAVHLLSKTLYPSEVSQSASAVAAATEAELTALVEREGVDGIRSFLTSRPEPTRELRALCWKLLLGYLPIASPAEWRRVQQGRRDAFARRWKDSLRMEGQDIFLLSADHLKERLEALKDEVEQTVRHFQHKVQQGSLLSIMALYLVSSDGNLPLVQGMTHMAAVLLYVFTAAAAPSEIAGAEADAFWCFAALLAEIKTRISDVQHSTASVHGLVGTSDSLLCKYDSELAQHFEALGFEPGVVCLRWFMLLLAKDAELLELLIYWDAFLADLKRFELAGYLCLAFLLHHRDALLESSSLLDLAELLQQLPSRDLDKPAENSVNSVNGSSVLRVAVAFRRFEERSAKGTMPPFPQRSGVEVVQGVAGAFFSGIFSNF